MKLNYYLSLAALIPAAILFVRIYQLDHIEKEPRRLLGARPCGICCWTTS